MVPTISTSATIAKRLFLLKQEFDQKYGKTCRENIKEVKEAYPELTKQHRRAGKALGNICFFIWYYAGSERDEVLTLLLRASVLLAAQDDFYDNSRISDKDKNDFVAAVEALLRECERNGANKSLQVRELLALWQAVNQEVKHSSCHLYDYWRVQAMQLNEAMKRESLLARQKNVAFNEYMETAGDSIGSKFIWAAYLSKKKISNAVLHDLQPILSIGSEIARLSNDNASYRTHRDRISAPRTLGGEKNPEKYTSILIAKKQSIFNKRLRRSNISEDIKRTLKRSVEFVVAFYGVSDFSS